MSLTLFSIMVHNCAFFEIENGTVDPIISQFSLHYSVCVFEVSTINVCNTFHLIFETFQLFSLFEVGVVGQIDNRVKCQPEFVWPYSKENREAVSHDPVHLWRSPQAFLELESEVSCIKVPRKGNRALYP